MNPIFQSITMVVSKNDMDEDMDTNLSYEPLNFFEHKYSHYINDLNIRGFPDFINKTVNTFNLIKSINWLKLDSSYIDNEQNYQVHKWVYGTSYLEYRSYDVMELDDMLLDNNIKDLRISYKNVLLFYKDKNSDPNIYDRFEIGNNYYDAGFIFTRDFFWISEPFSTDIYVTPKPNASQKVGVDELEELFDKSSLNIPLDYDINEVIKGFEEVIDIFN